jgi:sugar phosphate isomerase/epimerase
MTGIPMDSKQPLLGYCTNVHAGTSLDETLANLERHSVAVREQLGEDRLGIGLWLPERAAVELLDTNGVRRLRDRLDTLGLFVFTLNGFPQGDFHAEVVKHAVYQPDWRTPERAAYTIDLARILVDLLPDDLREGSISTLPLGWRTGFHNEGAAIENLVLVSHALAELEDRSGTLVHLDIEPEPGCFLDTAADVVALFEKFPAEALRHLRVCHDVCHSAVMFESQETAIETYRNAGIQIGKIQLSACPEIDFAQSEPDALEQLRSFVEPRYLHQTMIMDEAGGTHFFEDLPLALEQYEPQGCWRVHFHVPVFAQNLGAISTTQSQIRDCLTAIGTQCPMLEVETYAWSVLPEGHFKGDLAEGIAEELRWTRSNLLE